MNSKTRKSYVAAALSASMLLAATPVFAQEGKVEAKKEETKESCDAKVAAAEAKVKEAQAKVDALDTQDIKDAKRDLKIAELELESAKSALNAWDSAYTETLAKKTKEADEAVAKIPGLKLASLEADKKVSDLKELQKKLDQDIDNLKKNNGLQAGEKTVDCKFEAGVAGVKSNAYSLEQLEGEDGIVKKLEAAVKDEKTTNLEAVTKDLNVATAAVDTLKSAAKIVKKQGEVETALNDSEKGAVKKAADAKKALEDAEGIVKAYKETADALNKGIKDIHELSLYKADAKAVADAEKKVADAKAKLVAVADKTEAGKALIAAKAELEAAKKCAVKPEEGKKPEIVVPEKGNKGDKPKVPHTGVEF